MLEVSKDLKAALAVASMLWVGYVHCGKYYVKTRKHANFWNTSAAKLFRPQAVYVQNVCVYVEAVVYAVC